MNTVTVEADGDRIVVTEAPELARIPLSTLIGKAAGVQLHGHTLRLGCPAEEEIKYLIVGFDLQYVELVVEKVGVV